MARDEIERFRSDILEHGGADAHDLRTGREIDDATLLREVINTLGKRGRLGEQIRFDAELLDDLRGGAAGPRCVKTSEGAWAHAGPAETTSILRPRTVPPKSCTAICTARRLDVPVMSAWGPDKSLSMPILTRSSEN